MDVKASFLNEVRVIKIKREAVLELVYKALDDIVCQKFELPSHSAAAKHNRNAKYSIDKYFDEQAYEILLFAYEKNELIDRDDILAHIRKLPIEAIDSLLMTSGSEKYYHSIQNPLDEHSQHKFGNTTMKRKIKHVLSNLPNIFNRRVHPLKKHEVRIIRLSKQAVLELVWEYFMKNGDELFNIKNDENFDVTFCMNVEDRLRTLTIYAIDLKDATESMRQKLDLYCEQKLGITAESLIATTEAGLCYVSIPLPSII